MKSIVLCFFIIASLAVNLVELYEYDSNTNQQGPNEVVGAPSQLNQRPDVSLVGKMIARRNAPDYFKSEQVKTSSNEDANLETQRNKRHIPGLHYYHSASPIAAYPVATNLVPAPVVPAPVLPAPVVPAPVVPAPVVPLVEEAPYLQTYHYSPYGPYGGPYGGPFGGPYGSPYGAAFGAPYGARLY